MSGIDDHKLRHSALMQDIERVIFRRVCSGKIDGYTLDAAVEIAEIAVAFGADPFVKRSVATQKT